VCAASSAYSATRGQQGEMRCREAAGGIPRVGCPAACVDTTSPASPHTSHTSRKGQAVAETRSCYALDRGLDRRVRKHERPHLKFKNERGDHRQSGVENVVGGRDAVRVEQLAPAALPRVG
jgi:hypothetical protein